MDHKVAIGDTIYHIYLSVLSLHGRDQILLRYRLPPTGYVILTAHAPLRKCLHLTKSMNDQNLCGTA